MCSVLRLYNSNGDGQYTQVSDSSRGAAVDRMSEHCPAD